MYIYILKNQEVCRAFLKKSSFVSTIHPLQSVLFAQKRIQQRQYWAQAQKYPCLCRCKDVFVLVPSHACTKTCPFVFFEKYRTGYIPAPLVAGV